MTRKKLSGAEIDAIIKVTTSPPERAVAKRIEAARKPLRDMLAWQFRNR
jgi:hypothetical protein